MSFFLSKTRRNKSPRFFSKTIIITVLLVIILITIPVTPVLTLTAGDTNKTLFYTSIKDKQEFSIKYIHSIHLTPVTEEFYINKKLQIVVDKTIFDTFSVGIPSELEEGQTLKVENGKFIISNINRTLPYFDQRVGQVVANHQLIIDGKQIPLASLIQPGKWMRFQVKKWNLFQLMKGGN